MDLEYLKLVSQGKRAAEKWETRELREYCQITLRQAAKAINVAPLTLSRWERGLAIPRGDNAARFGALIDSLIEMSREP